MATMTRQQFVDKMVSEYNSDPNFGDSVMRQIDKYFSSMPKSTSKKDPHRLNSRATLTSLVKKALIHHVGPMDVDGQTEFNQMDVDEQIRFQALARQQGKAKWVHELDIIPANILSIRLDDKEMAAFKQNREQIDNAKLEDEPQTVDMELLMNTWCPALEQLDKPYWVVAALLLVTGRRTIEILKLGDLYLDAHQTVDGYECMFSGQAKQALTGSDPYEIKLLAPFRLVRAALDYVRKQWDSAELTNMEVNTRYGRTLTNLVQRKAGMTPHTLRGCNAMATFALTRKKMSLIGWIKKQLGQVTPKAASYYQRLIVQNPFLWKPAVKAAETEGWAAKTGPEKKRMEVIQEMIAKKMRITANAVRSYGGGSIAMIQKLIAANQVAINEHNNSL